MEETCKYFVSCPKNTTDLLISETKALGGYNIKESHGGIYFEGTLKTGVKHILWSRTASRIFLRLGTFPVNRMEDIYTGIKRINWNEVFDIKSTFSISTNLVRIHLTANPNYAAQVMKDAIVDQFRETLNARPSVDNKNPDITFNLLIQEETGIVSIDMSNGSLHKRGYRVMGGPAPLKENTAAAILLRSGWESDAKQGTPFVDGFCGTGTLLIEAAMIAGDIAPGLLREKCGLEGWKGFDQDLWAALIHEAEARSLAGRDKIPPIIGYDKEMDAVQASRKNIERADLSDKIKVIKCSFEEISPKGLSRGVMISNPPYGERLEEVEALVPLYKTIGQVLRNKFGGWKVSILTSNSDLSKTMGLKADKVNNFLNGPIECTLASFRIFSNDEKEKIAKEAQEKIKARKANSPGAEMFANRIRKNLKNLKKWVKTREITSFRLYDADMPEYSSAIDFYEGKWINMQEYAPPKEIDLKSVKKHRKEMLDGLKAAVEVYNSDIHFKIRKHQEGTSQYEKISSGGEKKVINENGLSFLINLTDYLDTGIFLDHRITRTIIRDMAAEKDFLNLFSYTGTATVYAAAGKAKSTTSVDNSNTYLNWAKENMALNGFTGKDHRYIKADCLQWLKSEKKRYDLIFLDPPTFSNSKNMYKSFAIQRDYPDLLLKTSKLLREGGILLFSTNFRKFKMEESLLPQLLIEDISADTIPFDFRRNGKIHYCWKIRRKNFER